MNRGSSSTRSSGRVPLGSRGNVTNIENGNAKAKTKGGLGTILPSKKDSRPVSFAAAVPVPTAPATFNRQSSTTTTTSMASESTGGGGVSAVSMGGGENNRAFDSLSSDTLRKVIGTTVSKQPLGGSSMMNQQTIDGTDVNVTSTHIDLCDVNTSSIARQYTIDCTYVDSSSIVFINRTSMDCR